MRKEDVIKGAVALIKQIATEKALEVVDKGVGHAWDGSFWDGILTDDSNIPNVKAKNGEYSIELRSFWGDPEIDIHRASPYGEELLVLTYSDSVKTEADEKYRHTGDYMVRQVRVESRSDYKKCVQEVYDMIEKVEEYAG